MYKLIIIGAIIVAIGWIAYGIWRFKIYREEKNQPKPRSERLVQSRKSFEDYMLKMKEFEKKKPYERKENENTNTKGE
ncbi:MAG: hypothetical protein V3W45_00960 [Sedimentisphaerales bacterium]